VGQIMTLELYLTPLKFWKCMPENFCKKHHNR